MQILTDSSNGNLIDAFCRVESGVIVESLIRVEAENDVVSWRFITESDIVSRGHPHDWYIRVQRIKRAEIPQYYRRRLSHSLIRNDDLTFGVEMTEYPEPPTISEFLALLKKEGVTKWGDMNETAKKLIASMVVSSFKRSIQRFTQSRGYDDVSTTINFIGCHIEKYDREGRRVQYLLAEAWSKYEWYMEQLKADLIPFPTKASDILDHFPKLSWDDSAIAAEAPTDTVTGVNDTSASSDDQAKT